MSAAYRLAAWLILVLMPTALGGLFLGVAIQTHEWSLLAVPGLSWTMAGLMLSTAKWS